MSLRLGFLNLKAQHQASLLKTFARTLKKSKIQIDDYYRPRKIRSKERISHFPCNFTFRFQTDHTLECSLYWVFPFLVC